MQMMDPAAAMGAILQKITDVTRHQNAWQQDIKNGLEQIRADIAGSHTRGNPGAPFAEGWLAARTALEGADGLPSIVNEAFALAELDCRVGAPKSLLLAFHRHLLVLFDERRKLSDRAFRAARGAKRGVKTSNSKDASRQAINRAATKNTDGPQRT
jgi:hypothetical protein